MHLHKQWSKPLFDISFLAGSLGPTTGNKDKFGRLRSVYHSEICPLSRRANQSRCA
jgi:hypothetical protein